MVWVVFRLMGTPPCFFATLSEENNFRDFPFAWLGDRTVQKRFTLHDRTKKTTDAQIKYHARLSWYWFLLPLFCAALDSVIWNSDRLYILLCYNHISANYVVLNVSRDLLCIVVGLHFRLTYLLINLRSCLRRLPQQPLIRTRIPKYLYTQSLWRTQRETQCHVTLLA